MSEFLWLPSRQGERFLRFIFEARAIGLHAGAALEARGFTKVFPSRALSGVFTQFEWYRGLSFVSKFEAAAFSFMFERKIRKEE